VTNSKNSRRQFLFNLSTATVQLAAANMAVYVVGSAFKNLDGSLVAGAKVVCPAQTGPAVSCPVSIPAGVFGDSLQFQSTDCIAAGGSGMGGIIADCDNPSGGPWHIQGL